MRKITGMKFTVKTLARMVPSQKEITWEIENILAQRALYGKSTADVNADYAMRLIIEANLLSKKIRVASRVYTLRVRQPVAR